MSDTYRPREGYFVNLKDGPRRFLAAYYFPGTGPEGETCAGCAHFLISSVKRKGRCSKWIAKRGMKDRLDARQEGEEDWWRGLPCIPSATLACKYWVEGEKE